MQKTSRRKQNKLLYPKSLQLVRAFRKIRRNEPCPCKSGKKFKDCNCDRFEALGDYVDLKHRGIFRDGQIIGVLEDKEEE